MISIIVVLSTLLLLTMFVAVRNEDKNIDKVDESAPPPDL